MSLAFNVMIQVVDANIEMHKIKQRSFTEPCDHKIYFRPAPVIMTDNIYMVLTMYHKMFKAFQKCKFM